MVADMMRHVRLWLLVSAVALVSLQGCSDDSGSPVSAGAQSESDVTLAPAGAYPVIDLTDGSRLPDDLPPGRYRLRQRGEEDVKEECLGEYYVADRRDPSTPPPLVSESDLPADGDYQGDLDRADRLRELRAKTCGIRPNVYDPYTNAGTEPMAETGSTTSSPSTVAK